MLAFVLVVLYLCWCYFVQIWCLCPFIFIIAYDVRCGDHYTLTFLRIMQVWFSPNTFIYNIFVLSITEPDVVYRQGASQKLCKLCITKVCNRHWIQIVCCKIILVEFNLFLMYFYFIAKSRCPATILYGRLLPENVLLTRNWENCKVVYIWYLLLCYVTAV